MGWITDRRNKKGFGLAHGREKSKRQSAPLKKIVEMVRPGDNNMFGRGDLVLLECGHEVFSKGTYKALPAIFQLPSGLDKEETIYPDFEYFEDFTERWFDWHENKLSYGEGKQ